MISKVSQRRSGFAASANYLLKKPEQAQVIATNCMSQGKGYAAEMQAVADGSRIEKPCWGVSLSLPPDEEITASKWAGIVDRFRQEMGLSDDHQFIAIRHTGEAHDHIHIIANRVSLKGDVWHGKFEALRARAATKLLEKEFGLQVVEIGKSRAPGMKGRESALLGEVQEKSKEVLGLCAGKSQADFAEAMERAGLPITGKYGSFTVEARTGKGRVVHFKAAQVFGESGGAALARAGVVGDGPVDLEKGRISAANEDLRRLFSKDSVLEWSTIKDAWSWSDDPEALARAMQRAGKLQIVGVDNEPMLSLPRIIERERGMVGSAERLAGDAQPLAYAAGFKQGLSDEQCAAFDYAAAGRRLSLIQGSAGAGKTHTLAAIAEAHRAAGGTVIGTATAKRMADDLGEGIKADSYTLASLLARLDRGGLQLDSNSMVMVDEGGQVSTAHLKRLFEHVEKSGARVIITGEDKQLDAVEHGGGLRHLTKKLGCARIKEIRRQSADWARDMVGNMRDGRADLAFAALAKNDCIRVASTRPELHKQAVDWFFDERQSATDDPILIARTNAEAGALGAEIRERLKAREVITGPDVRFAARHGTDNEFEQARRYDVELAVGDRIKFTQNDREIGITNGHFGWVEAVREGVVSITPEGGVDAITLRTDQLEEGRLPLAHAYAMTIYSSQGMTAPGNVGLMLDGRADRALAYVGASRAKGDTITFTDEGTLRALGQGDVQAGWEELAGRCSSDRYRAMALDYLTPEIEAGLREGKAMPHAKALPLPAMPRAEVAPEVRSKDKTPEGWKPPGIG